MEGWLNGSPTGPHERRSSFGYFVLECPVGAAPGVGNYQEKRHPVTGKQVTIEIGRR